MQQISQTCTQDEMLRNRKIIVGVNQQRASIARIGQ